jgi:hypothetical protein
MMRFSICSPTEFVWLFLLCLLSYRRLILDEPGTAPPRVTQTCFPGTYRREWRPSNWLHRRFYRVVYPSPSKLYATLLAGAKVHAEGGRTDSTQTVTSDALHILDTFLEWYV